MLDFKRKKVTNFTPSLTEHEKSTMIPTDKSKNIYDFVLKHDSQIKNMDLELNQLKSQILDLSKKNSLTNNNNNLYSNIDNNISNNIYNKDINVFSQIQSLKEEIKNDLIKDFNKRLVDTKNELNLFGCKKSNEKIIEINNSLEILNSKLLENTEENHEKQHNNSNIIKRMDNLDTDFDRLIDSLKSQFLNNNNLINELQQNKVNIIDYENEINEMNRKIENINIKFTNLSRSKSEVSLNSYNINNNNDINNNNINEINNKFKIFTENLNKDLEKINIKILDELKNQANDIKFLFQEVHNLQNKKENKNKNNNNDDTINSVSNYEFQRKNINKTRNYHPPTEKDDSKNFNSMNILTYIDSEIAKKANLDQLNYALETQAKLNEAFSSACRICRFCWDSEGLLIDNKFIQWSVQSINTALDVFKWENKSDNITILQNGIYKIVIGLIGLGYKKNFSVILNDENNIVIDSRVENNMNKYNNITNILDSDINFNYEKENIQFIEKYIICREDTKIKTIIFCNRNENVNDNSEEAFLEITKII